MATMYHDEDADLALIQSKKVAVIGYGSQGHAHALSLRDSGVDVVVGLAKDSKSRAKAEAEGLKVASVADAVKGADVVMLLAPDHVQRHIYNDSIAPNIKDGAALFFGHGFNIRFGYIKPSAKVDVCMVAPKGPGHLVRREYSAGRGNCCSRARCNWKCLANHTFICKSNRWSSCWWNFNYLYRRV
jgi:ketol-acid reductoisomerase